MPLTIRKIESEEELERKGKRNALILSLFMISILVFSTAGYFSLTDNLSASSAENNKNVENIGDSWILRFGDQTFRITNSPENGENVSILMFANLDKFYGKTVYVSSENDAEFYEIYSSLGVYTGRMQRACYGECEKNLPEKDCNETMIVVSNLDETEITKSGQGKVYEADNCVFIEGGMTAVDAFLYRIFGVN